MADDTNTKQPANKREESEERGWLSSEQQAGQAARGCQQAKKILAR